MYRLCFTTVVYLLSKYLFLELDVGRSRDLAPVAGEGDITFLPPGDGDITFR